MMGIGVMLFCKGMNKGRLLIEVINLIYYIYKGRGFFCLDGGGKR